MISRKNDCLQKIDQLIGEKIYSLRLAKGVSRQQLADNSRSNRAAVIKIRKGH